MVAPAMLRVSWFLIAFSISTRILVARILAELVRRLRNVSGHVLSLNCSLLLLTQHEF